MLTGKELGNAIKEAMRLKGVGPKEVAEHFGIKRESTYDWVKFGRISKTRIPTLVEFFADVVGLEHWGLPADFGVAGIGDYVPILSYSQRIGLGGSNEVAENPSTSHLMLRRSDLIKRRLNPENLRSFRSSAGDSMYPDIMENDEVIFDISNITPINKKLFALLVPGAASEEYQAKRCMIRKGEPIFEATNLEGDHDWKTPRTMEDGIKPVGRVVGIVRWLD